MHYHSVTNYMFLMFDLVLKIKMCQMLSGWCQVMSGRGVLATFEQCPKGSWMEIIIAETEE